ncbi:MAG TPA: CNNM domain-containing protein [Gemmatimonadaceae bacterium]|nr:CNNM domain-containing protein [Gemmatimonadaceae bacterium]
MSELLLLASALVLIAVLTAGGMAMRSVSRIWLRHWVEQRLRGSAVALAYLERPQRLIIASSAVIALLLVLSGEYIAASHAADLGTLTARLAIFAALVVVLGQLLPRAIARRFAPAVASTLSPLMEVAAVVAAPIAAAGRLASRPFARPPATLPESERDAIQDLLREGELEGVGEPAEMEIITGVMTFGDKTVREVMVSRDEIFAISRSATPRAIAEEFATSEFSRAPVYDGNLNHVVGMMHAFDVLKLRGERAPEIRPVAFTRDTAACSELLFRMLRTSRHLAIVQDDDERTVGLVTMEDLLEELVGDIRDEHDEPEPRPTT